MGRAKCHGAVPARRRNGLALANMRPSARVLSGFSFTVRYLVQQRWSRPER